MGQKEFTSNDLVKYHYNEIDTREISAIENFIEENWVIKNELEVFKSSLRVLDGVSFSPSQKSIDNIMKYAAVSSVVKPG
jgi:hypothetical protein